ncbi:MULTISPECIES: pteridine reductase [unclassified Pseudoxanthomonas]|uniref:pteridine reductase n=1 Tax=unclassified Pseudoxanthomonas TaxID=2645906 RepID=UPI0008E728AA|nr:MULTISPECIES: pteridine reductase [unclassified Pseudoxanthomonas]PPJ41121.1 KR domain-containing protein [Pseudoxanthomonas sp. KAs_5_3]SFV31198.1 pteridine reductase [Pseudoxanthomonas sp. YR558]
MSATRRVVLITGAARRVGAAIARRLHVDGHDLALHYRASSTDMQALVDELESARPGSTLALQAELADFDRLPELVARTVGHYGRLDALVNNASAFYPTPAGMATPAQWDELFAVNARAPFFLAQAAAPHLKAARGAIVNIADIYAERPRADLAVYAASKAALLAITRGLAVSLGPDVRANAVSPGAILWPDGGIDPALQEKLLAQTPLGRIGEPADIAATVAWLLSDAASYVTGQTLHVDGGRALG